MCNFIHSRSRKIKSSGYGYKIFRKEINGILTNFCQWSYRDSRIPFIRYELRENEALIWDRKIDLQPSIPLSPEVVGFCFFPTKKEVLRVLKTFSNGWGRGKGLVCHKIKYYKGIGRHYEGGMTLGTVDMALCREFTVLEEIEKEKE